MPDEKAKKVLLGITGGIAAYKSAELTRLLKKTGMNVQVVMTEAGTRFITPVTLQALSGNMVFVDAWDSRVANNMAHIELSRDADAILIAPASADFLAKLANGLANDLLSTLCLARQPTCALLVAPAMNREMWENAATQRNISQLRTDGVRILGPESGEQACGETGMGRMLEVDQLARETIAFFAPKLLSSRRALVTAGPTFESIDPVRGITNRSSGKMGYAIARALADLGAEVVLISGPAAIAPPDKLKLIRVESASQMLNAVKHELSDVDLFFSVAAVADYAPVRSSSQKIKKTSGPISIELVPTVDILAWVAAQANPPFCVGFAAESENVVEYARKKREKKKIPMIVANLATSAIGADSNEVTILDGDGDHLVPRDSKDAVARIIVNHAAKLFSKSVRLAKQPVRKSTKNA
ncbi:MAG: bifunctional phosphopantothenoylcysteine decarboxylase/phosphopantothenate--cysteine ligase CoaBC [Betaproteobacteria bacterium]